MTKPVVLFARVAVSVVLIAGAFVPSPHLLPHAGAHLLPVPGPLGPVISTGQDHERRVGERPIESVPDIALRVSVPESDRDMLDVLVNVRNVGRDFATFQVILKDVTAGASIGRRVVTDLAPGASKVVGFTWYPGSASGPRTVTATVASVSSGPLVQLAMQSAVVNLPAANPAPALAAVPPLADPNAEDRDAQTHRTSVPQEVGVMPVVPNTDLATVSPANSAEIGSALRAPRPVSASSAAATVSVMAATQSSAAQALQASPATAPVLRSAGIGSALTTDAFRSARVAERSYPSARSFEQPAESASSRPAETPQQIRQSTETTGTNRTTLGLVLALLLATALLARMRRTRTRVHDAPVAGYGGGGD